MEIRVGELPPEEWVTLSNRASLFASAAWLRAVAGRAAGPPHYFFLEEDGTPSVGLFAMVAETAATDDAFNLFEIIAASPRTMPLTQEAKALRTEVGKGAPPPSAWFPNLTVTLPSAECTPIGPKAGSLETIEALVHEIVSWARDQDMKAIYFPYLRRTHAALGAALSRRGFVRSPITYTCELHLPGNTFDDYLAMFSKHRRQSIRHEIRVVEEAGVEIRQRKLSEAVDQLVELRLSLKRKYGRTPNQQKERDTFTGLMNNFSEEKLNLLTAEADGKVLGFGLDLIHEGIWHGLVSGCDYDDPRSNFVSFHLDFYSPIKRAYEIGVRDFQFGIASWEAKKYRGSVLVPMDAWVLPFDSSLEDAVSKSASATRLLWEE